MAPGIPVDFVFNLGADTPVTFTSYSYSCASSCFGLDINFSNLLAPESSFELRFGSMRGLGDFGTAFVSNSDPMRSAFNLGGALRQLPLPNPRSDASILVSVSSLFVRISYYNDTFGLDSFELGGTTQSVLKTFHGSCIANCAGIAPVPLPAALPSFVSAIAAVALIGRRRRQSSDRPAA